MDETILYRMSELGDTLQRRDERLMQHIGDMLLYLSGLDGMSVCWHAIYLGRLMTMLDNFEELYGLSGDDTSDVRGYLIDMIHMCAG